MKSIDPSMQSSIPVHILSHVQTIDPHPEWYDIADENHFWMQWRYNALLGLLGRCDIPLGESLHALDIGCGHGILTRQLEVVSRWTIDGADLNLSALRTGVSSRGEKYFYDITDCHPSLVGRYDIVLVFDVLEHIGTPHRFLAAALRHLKVNGCLIVNVPAFQSLFSAYDRAAGHLRRYDRKSLSDEVSAVPVTIRGTRYWGACLIPVLAARKLLLSKKKDNGVILSKGFKVPHPTLNRIFLGLMRLEDRLHAYPPMGSSLLLVAQKV